MKLLQLSQTELTELADKLLQAIPELDERQQRLALSVYRLLAEGKPVSDQQLAKQTNIPRERVSAILSEWPGVYRDEEGNIIGFWGLAQQEFPPHHLEIDGQKLWGWCAWDTLFLPFLLGRTARVESVCATTGQPVTAIVNPDRVQEISPAGSVVSFLRPDGPFSHDVILSFCHRVLFFSSEEAGTKWKGAREDGFLLSLDQAFELGRLVWEAKFSKALNSVRLSV
jgi:alkylmercury lyase